MTAYGSIEDAVTAMKEGALDFLAKPVDPDHLLLLVGRALEQRRLVTENLLMKEELAVRRGAPQLVGQDPSFRKIFASLQRAAGDRYDRTARRRERHRQRTVRTVAARAQPARGGAVCRDQLRRDPGHAARDGVVRAREGRVHGRPRAQARQVRDGASRHAVPRRDRRPPAGAPGEDPACARRAAVRARRRDCARQRRCPARRGDEQGPSRRGDGAALPRGSVLQAVGVPDHRAAAARSRRRHPAARALLRRSLLPRSEEKDADAFGRRRSSSCRPTGGPGMSASSRTASSARSSSPTATPSCRAT